MRGHKSRREQIRQVKQHLTRVLHRKFAGKHPTVEQAVNALENELKFYPLPVNIAVRINQVKPGPPPVLMIDVYDPELEKRRAFFAKLQTMTPEQLQQVGKQIQLNNEMASTGRVSSVPSK